MAHFTSQDDRELEAPEDYGVWTNIREIVELTTRFFDSLWEKLEISQQRRNELKFGMWLRFVRLVVFLIFVFVTILFVTHFNLLSAFFVSLIVMLYRAVIEKVLGNLFRRRA